MLNLRKVTNKGLSHIYVTHCFLQKGDGKIFRKICGKSIRVLVELEINSRKGGITVNVQGVLDSFREEFLETFTDQSFNFEFVDEFHNQMYEEERKMSKVILFVALLANLIAALGLYGLIAYSTTLRTREVGLWKVLGANFVSISKLFSKEFILLVLLANLASWPLVFLIARQWLQTFPYRIVFSVLPYLAALIVTVAIAYGSMLYHTHKASNINPADSLRYE